MTTITVEAPTAQAPTAPPPPGPSAIPPATPAAPMDDPDAPKKDETLELGETAEICADIYHDAFGAVAQLWAKIELELPEARAQRRGKQIAVVLRKLGWEDDEILCYLGLGLGVLQDFGMIARAKAQSAPPPTPKAPGDKT